MFWFHPDLERIEKKIQNLEYTPKLVFYGSSTFTLWDELTTIFKPHNPLNLGFGGSTLAACTWFFDRVFNNIKEIDAIVIYAGDNDLGNGRHPEEILLFLENLLLKIRKRYGNIKCTCISIKPSIARNYIQESIHYTNKGIKELMMKDENFYYIDIYNPLLDKSGKPDIKYFENDGLHFNKKGYQVLSSSLLAHPEIFPKKTVDKID
jgi:lysophospholipase L1-like esterase